MIPNRSEVVAKPYKAVVSPGPAPPATTVPTINGNAVDTDQKASDDEPVPAKSEKQTSSFFKRFEMGFTKKFKLKSPGSKRGSASQSRASKQKRGSAAQSQSLKRERESVSAATEKPALFSPQNSAERKSSPTAGERVRELRQAPANPPPPKKKRLQKIGEKLKSVRKKPGTLPELQPQSPGRIRKKQKSERGTVPPENRKEEKRQHQEQQQRNVDSSRPASGDSAWYQWPPSNTTLRNGLIVAGVAIAASVAVAMLARGSSSGGSKRSAAPGGAGSRLNSVSHHDSVSFLN